MCLLHVVLTSRRKRCHVRNGQRTRRKGSSPPPLSHRYRHSHTRPPPPRSLHFPIHKGLAQARSECVPSLCEAVPGVEHPCRVTGGEAQNYCVLPLRPVPPLLIRRSLSSVRAEAKFEAQPYTSRHRLTRMHVRSPIVLTRIKSAVVASHC